MVVLMKIALAIPTFNACGKCWNELLDSVDMSDDNGERDYCILTLFLNCGMRLSELVGINLSDIDSEMRKMVVTGKGSKQRTIYLNQACRNALEAYLKVREKLGRTQSATIKDKNALFLSSRGNRISNKTVQWLVKKQALMQFSW